MVRGEKEKGGREGGREEKRQRATCERVKVGREGQREKERKTF